MGDPGNTVEKTYLKSTKNVNLTWNNCSETAALSDRGRGAAMPSSAFQALHRSYVAGVPSIKGSLAITFVCCGGRYS